MINAPWQVLLVLTCHCAQSTSATECAAGALFRSLHSKLQDTSYWKAKDSAWAVLQQAVSQPLAAGCEFISLTSSHFHVSSTFHTPGLPAKDVWPNNVRAIAQTNGVSSVGGASDVEAARTDRHAVWTEQHLQGAEPAVGTMAVAMLHASDSARALHSQLQKYPVHLVTQLEYAWLFGYDMLLYARSTAMPDNVTGHFSKIAAVYGALFAHGYSRVLLADWDSYIDPLSAVPLPVLLTGFTQAGVFLQFEENMCSCVMVFKRQENTKRILHEWWEWAMTGAFNGRHTLHDQAALKIVMHKHLREVTGQAGFFNPSFVPAPGKRKRNEDSWPKLELYIAEAETLRSQSDFGFVGLAREHDWGHVALLSCLGLWAGCIPAEAPALLRHHGHEPGRLESQAASLMEAVQVWTAVAHERSKGAQTLSPDQEWQAGRDERWGWHFLWQ